MKMDEQKLIFGANDEVGLVALEHVVGKEVDEMLLFFRRGRKTEEVREAFTPFLWLMDSQLPEGAPTPLRLEKLAGGAPLNHLAFFRSWKEFQKAVDSLKKATGYTPSAPGAPYFLFNDPIHQHLVLTGRTLFKGLLFGDLKRLQVDIETYTERGFEFSNAERAGDRIIAIALADETGWTEVLDGSKLDEKKLLEQWVKLVQEKDPDVIEGHNFFQFDLPYLIARARRHGVKLALGRNSAPPKVHPSRLSIAERTLAYPKAEIFGRHIVDTYFLAQFYDISHRSLEGFGLKDIAIHFGLAEKDRTYIEGSEIARTFDREPQKLMAYARDDVAETRAISNLLSASFFTQCQLLPYNYQNVCVRGSGTKVDALMIREYVRQCHALPLPQPAREFAGGYTDIFLTGVFQNVHHADVRSLYPSLMLKLGLKPRSDELGVFTTLLAYLRDLRLDAKRKMQQAKNRDEEQHQDALQSTFKILINSFYGYLGFGTARFCDFAAAEKVAAEGRRILQTMIAAIKEQGGTPIEIDTDGVYFLPPEKKIEAFRVAVQSALPEGIDIEFDDRYRAMLSYKMKNYALLDDQGEIIIKGAALKSRGLEKFQRKYLREWLRLKLEGRDAEIPKVQNEFRRAIRDRAWPIEELAKTETLQDAPATYAAKIKDSRRGRNAAYELALKSGREYRAGDQISYYVTGTAKGVAVHGAAKLATEFDDQQRDENVAYYLAKLDALIEKFDALFSAEAQDSRAEGQEKGTLL
ncbi:MAG: DNA polymerase II [Verrucomicrobia bacterium]|nr:MAG: DNA polymerase II [Verrucomicrobiota bacterium]